MTSSIQLIKQESLRTERYTRNGTKKEVHVVVKRLPFVVKIRGSHVNFHSDSIKSTVLFDDGADKPVGFVSKNPLEYVAHVTSDGTEATIEVRLSCLTSQFEGNLFKLRFQAGSAWIDSAPVKVISKAGTALPKEPKTVGGGTKRTINQVVANNIARLAEQQQAILEMQQRQLDVLQYMTPNLTWSSPDQSSPSAFNLTPISENEPDLDISSALRCLASAYRRIPTPERAAKVRRAMKSLDDESQTDVGDFLKTVSSEPLFSLPSEYAYGFPDSPSQFGGDLDGDLFSQQEL